MLEMFRMNGGETGEFPTIEGDTLPALTVSADVMRIDPHDVRPSDVGTQSGDPGQGKRKLVFEPKVTAREMCAEMVAEYPSMARPDAQHVLSIPVCLDE